ncbi:MAG: alpha-2-macroglobulin, partial [Bacteroidetes bacterium]|nr:alpha-2-macroglobulin [Bacteroidota bacterium]
MKHQFQKITLLLLTILLISQYTMAQTDYESKWKGITKMEEEGKTKDAATAVETLLEKARKDNNNTQIVKALLHKYKYMMTLEEDAELKIVNGLKSEINTSTGAEKAILQSILAELYYQYYQENTWKFSDRTETDTKQSDDFRTWDLKTIFKEINAYYIASLEQKTLLQQTKLDAFTPILINQKRSTFYRPTLYELLAHRAIDYFNDTKSNLAEPENAFTIDQEAYFSSA